ncbi:MAG: hypothetical protein ACYTFI_09410, partial [Planctomycetota bacterium]
MAHGLADLAVHLRRVAEGEPQLHPAAGADDARRSLGDVGPCRGGGAGYRERAEADLEDVASLLLVLRGRVLLAGSVLALLGTLL